MENYDGYILNKETLNIIIKLCEERILTRVKVSLNRNGSISKEVEDSITKEKYIIDRLEDIISDDYYIGDECGKNIKDLNKID